MLQAGPLISLSPSFTTTNANGYSSSSAGNLAEIAARVVSELRRENPDSAANFLFDDDHDQPWLLNQNDDGESESEFEFEFSVAVRDSPISADEIFHNGQIKAAYVYPLFGKNLVDLDLEKGAKSEEESRGNDGTALPVPSRRRQALRKLMGEEEEEWNSTSCSSSSEIDEIDGLSPATYCAWDPNNSSKNKNNNQKKKNLISDSEKKKSRSTGTSRRWNLRDLILNRSNSDGGPKETATKKGGKVAAATEEKKNDLVGFLSNVNGLSRNLHPF